MCPANVALLRLLVRGSKYVGRKFMSWRAAVSRAIITSSFGDDLSNVHRGRLASLTLAGLVPGVKREEIGPKTDYHAISQICFTRH